MQLPCKSLPALCRYSSPNESTDSRGGHPNGGRPNWETGVSAPVPSVFSGRDSLLNPFLSANTKPCPFQTYPTQ